MRGVSVKLPWTEAVVSMLVVNGEVSSVFELEPYHLHGTCRPRCIVNSISQVTKVAWLVFNPTQRGWMEICRVQSSPNGSPVPLRAASDSPWGTGCPASMGRKNFLQAPPPPQAGVQKLSADFQGPLLILLPADGPLLGHKYLNTSANYS